MKLTTLVRKAAWGMPYAVKDVRARISNSTPLMIARPRVVHLWRNAPCNAKCVMCYFGYSTGEALKALYKSPLEDSMVPGVLHEIGELGGRGTMVSYVGGEPLLAPDILEWLSICQKHHLDFRFTSNGYVINEEMARKLVSAGLFNIGISLESLDPAINEQIRPYAKGTEKTVNAIEFLLAEKQRQNGRLSINIKCTLTDLNLESIIRIAERWGKTPGVLVTPQMFEAMDGMPEATRRKFWISDLGRIEKTMARLKEMRETGYAINADDQALNNFVALYKNDPGHNSTMSSKTVVDSNQPQCNIGTDSLFIQDASVRLCPNFPVIGNLLEPNRPTLKEMWFGPKAEKEREQIRKCKKVCTLSCLRQPSLIHKVKVFLKL
jgi:MoaA/NifB/PqqE/SkfB family radical SAM enzyme